MSYLHFKPGDRLRVRAKNPYPPLSRLIREMLNRDDTVVVERAWQDSGIDYVQVKYPNEKLSGALYADMFEVVKDG